MHRIGSLLSLLLWFGLGKSSARRQQRREKKLSSENKAFRHGSKLKTPEDFSPNVFFSLIFGMKRQPLPEHDKWSRESSASQRQNENEIEKVVRRESDSAGN